MLKKQKEALLAPKAQLKQLNKKNTSEWDMDCKHLLT
jgi:hypothetical protein